VDGTTTTPPSKQRAGDIEIQRRHGSYPSVPSVPSQNRWQQHKITVELLSCNYGRRGGSRACRQSRRMGRLLPHRPNSARETERFSDGTARPPPCRAYPARIGSSNHKITVELLSCNYGRRGAWKIRSSLLQKNQQRTLVLPSSVI
jgi:hypothetical protein